MHNDPIYLLEPVFHWLDQLVHNYGDYLYMLLVYVSLPLIAWILSGGLRRRLPRQPGLIAIPIIVIRSPATPPPLPPEILRDHRRPSDDEQSFAA